MNHPIDRRSEREKIEDEIHELEELRDMLSRQSPVPSAESLREIDNTIEKCKKALLSL
jgi:dsDNA-specific endonuclease/ATPase MutS2